MKNFNAFDWVALAVLAVGGLNWGLIGAFDFNLVSTLFGDMTILTRTIYGLVGVSALYMIFTAFMASENVYESTPKTRVVNP
jgi:uncharacterized membrane protein YuzA (DUF378 family)